MATVATVAAIFVFADRAMAAPILGAPNKAGQPKAQLEGALSSALRGKIVQAIGDLERPIGNRFEARRRAREAGDDAAAVLRSEGYYGGEVEAAVTETDPPQALVRVSPGPRFLIADPTIEWIAPVPSLEAQAAGEAVLGLANGQASRAAEILSAEGRIAAATRARGYADTEVQVRTVTVDHADHSVKPVFRIATGDLVRLGGVNLSAAGKTNSKWLRSLTPWRQGETYSPKAVADLEKLLLDTGVYDSVTVGLAPKDQITAGGLRPVIVSLSDRPRSRLDLGASYSSTEGAGADARWTRYNLIRRADTEAVFVRASNLDSQIGLDLSLPHWLRAGQTLKAQAKIFRLQTSAYRETGVSLNLDAERRYSRTSFVTLGGSLDYGVTDETQRATLQPLGRSLLALSGLVGFALDRSDDVLDPKRGWRVEARVEPTTITGATSLTYLKVQSQGTAYWPLDARSRTVLAGRLKVGSIIGGTIPATPASRRFYSGGGGSVRGYSFQAIGPHLADNTPEGGASLLEASVEVRRRFGEHWGVAAFLDAGSIGADPAPQGENMNFGAGVGLRYDLGFGPIRFDLAFPLHPRSNDPTYQIYLSIGQSF